MPHRHERSVTIEVPGASLPGCLTLPPEAIGLVVFVHGSGSSRHSSRNRQVAHALVKRGFATLLFDLLTEDEDRDHAARFDIPLLTQRLLDATAWAHNRPALKTLPLGYFGASTGAAAALRSAALPDADVHAVVARGGRPDLAQDSLSRVTAPTLLIVGGADPEVLALNRRAYAQLPSPKELAVVAGATHLFEEPGALDQVARLAGDWFQRHCARVHEAA
ncbi:MAG: alpha/beta family hydrolase [Pseudomonadota bacterium]